jgi:hypothetical protein
MSSTTPPAKIFLLGVVAQILERQHRERGNNRLRGAGLCLKRRSRFRLGDEAIANPRDSRDPLAAIGRASEEFAKRRDHGEVAFLDSSAWPRRIHELGLGSHLTGALQQGPEEQCPPLSDG